MGKIQTPQFIWQSVEGPGSAETSGPELATASWAREGPRVTQESWCGLAGWHGFSHVVQNSSAMLTGGRPSKEASGAKEPQV